MASKSITRDFLTLPLALLIGAGIAALTRGGGVEGATGSGTTTLPTTSAWSSTTAAAHPAAANRSPEATACAAAWESLKDGRLTAADREKAQAAILAEWVLHDPASALEAVYADRPALGFLGDPLRHFDLLPAVAANPEIVGELLSSGRLGLHAHEFRALWFQLLAEEDPVPVLDRLDEISENHLNQVLGTAVESLPAFSQDPTALQAGLDRISAILAWPRTGEEADNIAAALGRSQTLAELGSLYGATADPHLQEVYAIAAADRADRESQAYSTSPIPNSIDSLAEPFRSAVIDRFTRTRILPYSRVKLPLLPPE